MKVSKQLYQLLAVAALLASLADRGVAASPVTVTIDAGTSKADTAPVVPADFLGVSYETQMVLPDSQGKYYFSPENKRLVQTFQTLGIRNLRVGGNTADRTTVKIPSPADLDQLFAFAKATDAKVIYTLRMNGGDPKAAADTAKYIMEHYKDRLACFAIGNEPNVFATEYPAYIAAWKDYAKQVTAVVPEAKFCGPSATPGKAVWAKDFANDVAGSGLIAMITQHDYPGGSARKVTDTAAARELMLSPDWVKYNEKFAAKFVPTVTEKKLPFRLEEANSFFHGGAKDVSDTLASALWALDYLYWWASHGTSGINFHTGDKVAAGDENTVCRYAVFTSAPDGYAVRPIGYAIKAFDLSSHGQIAPAKISSNAENLNLRAYAVRQPSEENLTLVLINKESRSGHDASISIAPGRSFDRGTVMYLSGSDGDIAATTGIRLGGSAIGDDGTWAGKPKEIDPAGPSEFKVELPAATAAIVHLLHRSK